jgi:RHS repeat-associated protein
LSYDHLGSVRLVTDQSAQVVARHDFVPFGQEIPAGWAGRGSQWGGSDGVGLRFTGQERDAETGLDYFGARYFGSALGRWTSPDRMNVTDDKLLAPSTLNKYVYAANNPLSFVDLDGRDVTALFLPPHGIFPGHFMLFANNPENGQSALMSFGPTDTSSSDRAIQVFNGPVGGTTAFQIPKSADELRQNYAALTIQTTPEEAQDVINFIKQHPGQDLMNWQLLGPNCTTVCRDALKAVGILPRNFGSITPAGLWSALYARFGNPSTMKYRTTSMRYGEQSSQLQIPTQQGIDYGNPNYGMDTFRFLELWLRPQCTETWDPDTNTLHGCQ